jgi:Tfp pilus assembly protein PilN
MIKRINLIEKQVLVFTYLTLAQVFLGVLVFMSLLGGWQFLKVYRADRSLAEVQVKVDALKTEQKKLKAKPVKPVKERISIGEFQALLDLMESAPQWSKVLQDISHRLPTAVWITSFKSVESASGGGESGRKKKGKAETDKDDEKSERQPAPVHRLEFAGHSLDVRNVSEFLASLAKSNYFKNLTLSESVKDATDYRFVIKSEASNDAE